ncbi:hypothetical protein HY488_01295, partial [Candidatus Woesearchaeota archaeon]|nr:hypothetical protein [Candidatus Woesearchaeota archaeon]
MEFTYTLHAEEQIEARKMPKIWVEETVKFPDVTKYQNGKYYAIKKLNGLTLKVVYTKERYINII